MSRVTRTGADWLAPASKPTAWQSEHAHGALQPMAGARPTFAPVTLSELLGLALFAIAFVSLVIGLMA